MYDGELILKPMPDGESWWVQQPFYFLLDLKYEKIKPGFITDFASIPKAFQWFEQPATGKHRTAAVCHDWMYSEHPCSRKEADDTFLTLMLHDGYNQYKAHILYIIVRLFGGSHWNKNGVD